MEQSRDLHDLHDILEIPRKKTNQDEINKAFHKKINQLNQTGATEETKTEVYDAHAILINPAKKEIYRLGRKHGYCEEYKITEDLYDTLRITREADIEQIRNAYDHTYTIEHQTGASEKRKQEITFAYEILKDRNRRRAYDIGWKRGFSEEYKEDK